METQNRKRALGNLEVTRNNNFKGYGRDHQGGTTAEDFSLSLEEATTC
jgi:hypothetical protein